MKNLKIISYQRNGVSGDGFYVATCNEFGKDFVVTFDTNGTDKHINSRRVRVTCLSDLAEKWRGDDFADVINRMLNKRLKPTQTFYDLIETPEDAQ